LLLCKPGAMATVEPPDSFEANVSSPPSVSEPIDPSVYGLALADVVKAAVPDFVVRVVQDRRAAFANPMNPSSFEVALAQLAQDVTAALDPTLRAFLTSDVDTQRTTPLSIIRNHMAPVTELLRSVECAHADRDPFDESAFPYDVFAVGPHAWADFGEAVHEAGLRWGAAKAMAHRQRHRAP
jgi:hypothetical protein